MLSQFIKCLFFIGQTYDICGFSICLTNVVANHFRQLFGSHGISMSFSIHATIGISTVFFQQEAKYECRHITGRETICSFKIIVDVANSYLTGILECGINHLIDVFFDNYDMLVRKFRCGPVVSATPHLGKHRFLTTCNKSLDICVIYAVTSYLLRLRQFQLCFS